jgi:hypothetical protein
VLGGFVGVKGLLNDNTLIKVGGIISTNSTLLGYLQIEDFQLPFAPRIFIKPDILAGRIGSVKNYSEQIGTSTFGTNVGQNNSDESNYFEADGKYRWYEFTIRYMLPIGWAKDHTIAKPKFNNGILVSGETGGYDLNPFKSGRTFIGTKLFYKSLTMTKGDMELTGTGAGYDFFINLENLDYVWNPTVGYNLKFTYSIDSKMMNSSKEFEILKGDLSWFVPLNERKSAEPCVLALNFSTVQTPSWYDSDPVVIGGHTLPEYHRPENFVGASLGGPYKMRAYQEYRFYDCSSIYYCAELRKILPWNPLNDWWLTRKVGSNWIQLAAFAELGRVAPYWRLSTLHEDMKWDLGGGVRLFMNGILLRIDVATGKEGTLLQMFYNYSF